MEREALVVSVPCASCGVAIVFGQSKCTQCGAKPSSEARAALHERLAAASEDYRDLQSQIVSGRTALLVASLVYLGTSAFGLFLTENATFKDDEAVAAAREALLSNALFACLFLGFWWLSKHKPTLGLLSAAAVWLVSQLLILLLDPLSGFSGLWVKGVVAILMIRGIIAALRANLFTRRVVAATRKA